MASSLIRGFSVDIELVKAYHAFNKDKKEAYIIMKYSDDGKKLIIDEKGPVKKNAKSLADKNKHWEKMVLKLVDNQVRWVVIQVDYKDAKGNAKNENLLVFWSPEQAEIMSKMQAETHTPVILKCLAGIRDTVTAYNTTQLDISQIVKDKLKGSLD